MNKKILIKQGENWAENDPMLPTVGTIWQREYRFTESCLYKNTGTEGYGINKLWGVSGFPYHKRNSVRIGWMPHEEGQYIKMYATAYINGRREIRYLSSVQVEQKVVCLISNQGNNASVWINTQSTTFKVRIPLLTYTLPAYFGGIPPAPHDMTIIRLK
jgi:hypothetical protein